MNKLQAIVLYDAKANTYSPPFFSPTREAAKRDFGMLVNDGKSLQSQFPADFDLFVVGEYDTLTAVFRPFDKVHLANGVDVKIN